MLKAIEETHKLGKGIYGMKPLGGGHLIGEAEEAFNFVKSIPFIDSFAIGMQSKEEIDSNISWWIKACTRGFKRELTKRKEN